MHDYILTALAAARHTDLVDAADHARAGAAVVGPARPRHHLLPWAMARAPQRRPAATTCLSC